MSCRYRCLARLVAFVWLLAFALPMLLTIVTDWDLDRLLLPWPPGWWGLPLLLLPLLAMLLSRRRWLVGSLGTVGLGLIIFELLLEQLGTGQESTLPIFALFGMQITSLAQLLVVVLNRARNDGR